MTALPLGQRYEEGSPLIESRPQERLPEWNSLIDHRSPNSGPYENRVESHGAMNSEISVLVDEVLSVPDLAVRESSQWTHKHRFNRWGSGSDSGKTGGGH